MTQEDFKRIEQNISEEMKKFRKEHEKEIDALYTIIAAEIVKHVSDVIFRRNQKNEVLLDKKN